jgi:tRNA pseudouridine38-40 synthase
VGVLAAAGRGQFEPRDAERLLASPSDEIAKLTAPPSGLFLERVYYEGDDMRRLSASHAGFRRLTPVK